MADVRATTARRSASWHGGFLEENIAHDVTPTSSPPALPTYSGMKRRLSHRNSDSTVQEDMGAAHRNGQLVDVIDRRIMRLIPETGPPEVHLLPSTREPISNRFPKQGRAAGS